MSDQHLGQLLDRVVDQAPPVVVEGEQMLAAGKRRVRQRRTVGAGMGIAGLALVGALWGTLGDGLLGSLDEPAPASTTWEVAADTTVALRPGEDGDLVMANGALAIGEMTLHARADGTSALDLTVDGAARTIEGEGLLFGRMVAYAGEKVTVVAYPLPEGRDALLLGGGPESVAGHATVAGEPVGWSVVRTGPDGAVPSDVLLLPSEGEGEPTTLSEAQVDSARIADGQLLWQVADADAWGLTWDGLSGHTSTDSPVLRLGSDDEMTWVARLPEDAELARLVDGDGQLLEAPTWQASLGDQQIVGGRATWSGTAGSRVEWSDGQGAWQSLEDEVPSLTLADGSVAILSIDGDEITATIGEESYPSVITPGGPLATLWGEGRPVVLVHGWDLADPRDARISEDGDVWRELQDAVTVVLGDGTPVTVLVVPDGPPAMFGEADGDEVTPVP